MPIFMDRHHGNLGSLKDVAEAHQQDLKVQKEFDVKFLTYWFDSKGGMAFCLVDAPTKEALTCVHEKAHGDVPADIIEVELADVEALLNRISDPKPIELPSGEVQPGNIDSPLRIILFTDLKDSTRLTVEHGDLKAMKVLRIHNDIIRSALAEHHGREIKHTGDGLMTCFTSVDDAIIFSIAVQKAFSIYNAQNPEIPLHVRIGMNAGLPIEEGGDLFGSTVQLAARICSHAKPGQILVSAITRELCCNKSQVLQFIDSGRASLKGFLSAIQLYEVKYQD